MKHLAIIILAIGITSMTQAQVGIKTDDPQQALHLGDNNSTIRIESLNSTNNANNLGGIHSNNLNIDNVGDVSIEGAMVEVLREDKNAATSRNIKTLANSSYDGTQLYTRTFTLTRRAQLFIDYSVSCNVLNFDGTAQKADGRSKVIYTFYYLGNGTTPDTTDSYGITEVTYTNSSTDAGNGAIHNYASGMHTLEAGTYSIHMMGGVLGGGLDNDASFSATFANEENLKIIALYF